MIRTASGLEHVLGTGITRLPWCVPPSAGTEVADREDKRRIKARAVVGDGSKSFSHELVLAISVSHKLSVSKLKPNTVIPRERSKMIFRKATTRWRQFRQRWRSPSHGHHSSARPSASSTCRTAPFKLSLRAYPGRVSAEALRTRDFQYARNLSSGGPASDRMILSALRAET